MRPDQQPLSPVYPFGSAGEEIELYAGPIRLDTGAYGLGRIFVPLEGELHVRWAASALDFPAVIGDANLSFDHPDFSTSSIPAAVDNSGGAGSINRAELGDTLHPLSYVIAHFANLPWILPASGLAEARHLWAGRWTATGGGWTVTLDVRPDHTEAMRSVQHTDRSVITHTGRLERSDGGVFTGLEAADALEGWQLALSFAVGRWVAPVAPVGFDRQGRKKWEQWAAWRSWPARGHLYWWDHLNAGDLREYVQLFMDAWSDPVERAPLRHIAHHLIAANHRGTTVEARIMLIQAALEYLSWVTHVLSNRRSRTQHKLINAEQHLRDLLVAAHIPLEIPVGLEALRRFAGEEKLADGPAAVINLRNRLVHPKDADEPYRIDRLVSDAWRLSAEYGDLLLLSRLGYQGRYLPRSKVGGWITDRARVPWLSPWLPR
jgi:hypothetical protein